MHILFVLFCTLLFYCRFYSLFIFFTYIYALVLCYFYIIFIFVLLHCPLSGPDLIYISLLIIPCIIYYVTNKETLKPLHQIHKIMQHHMTPLTAIYLGRSVVIELPCKLKSHVLIRQLPVVCYCAIVFDTQRYSHQIHCLFCHMMQSLFTAQIQKMLIDSG